MSYHSYIKVIFQQRVTFQDLNVLISHILKLEKIWKNANFCKLSPLLYYQFIIFTEYKQNYAKDDQGKMPIILNKSEMHIKIYTTSVLYNLPTKFHENWKTLLLGDFEWLSCRQALKLC